MYTLHNMKIRYPQEIALMKPKKTLYTIVLRVIQVKDPTCLKSQRANLINLISALLVSKMGIQSKPVWRLS